MAKDEQDSVDEALTEAQQEGEAADAAKQDTFDRLPLRAAIVFDIISREGSGELARGIPALWWSGVAAGLSIGLSVLSEAILHVHLPESPYKFLIENMGYSVGFLVVIMSRQQLFTENTLTAVLPVIKRKKWNWLLALLRLWSIVLCANIVGCLVFALFIAKSGVLSEDVQQAIVDASHHLVLNTPMENFARGIAAGFLIALLVWMLPSAEGNEFAVIALMTYIIAIGEFTHVVAGSVEAIHLWLAGQAELLCIVLVFFLPTLIGNIVGGTGLFAVICYAQVREEIHHP